MDSRWTLVIAIYAVLYLAVVLLLLPENKYPNWGEESWHALVKRPPFWRWPDHEELGALLWGALLVGLVLMFAWSVLEVIWEGLEWAGRRLAAMARERLNQKRDVK